MPCGRAVPVRSPPGAHGTAPRTARSLLSPPPRSSRTRNAAIIEKIYEKAKTKSKNPVPTAVAKSRKRVRSGPGAGRPAPAPPGRTRARPHTPHLRFLYSTSHTPQHNARQTPGRACGRVILTLSHTSLGAHITRFGCVAATSSHAACNLTSTTRTPSPAPSRVHAHPTQNSTPPRTPPIKEE